MHLFGGSGLDVLHGVFSKTPETVFIVLTNYPNPQYRKAYMDAGASYFLDKSTEIATVAKIIAGLRDPLPNQLEQGKTS
jgi:DNA-binding NarL/FixJ family response regulator